MTHPLDQLAPFVDGTLDAAERAVVEEHLRSCTRCRGEAEAADAARAALRAMPEPKSPDLSARFTPEELVRLAVPPTSAGTPWSKFAPVLAAAAVVALVALVVPRLGTRSEDAGVAADGVVEAGSDQTGAPLRLELLDEDLDEPAVQEAATAFAASYAQAAAPDAGVDAGQTATGAEATGPDQARTAGPARTARAVSCVEQAFPGFPGEIVRVQHASFEGTPVFLAYVLERPGAESAPNTLSIWVADAGDCSIVTFTSVHI